jgi:hypothetical protein
MACMLGAGLPTQFRIAHMWVATPRKHTFINHTCHGQSGVHAVVAVAKDKPDTVVSACADWCPW